MTKKFKQISNKPTYMKYNGGLHFREKSKKEYEFKVKVAKRHLNSVGITHGGYIATIIDSGVGTAAYRVSKSKKCVTVSLDIKLIRPTKLGDIILGLTKVLKKTKTMVFLNCTLKSKGEIIAFAAGVWKILK